MTRMLDLRREQQRSGNTEIEHIVNTVKENDAKILKLKRKLSVVENAIARKVEAGKQSNVMIKYIEILKKHKINLYYFLKGSVQGVMCGRICNAKLDLVNLIKEMNYPAGCLWELFFNNLSYLYKMLKHKHAHKWHMYQLATMKYAYIELYYQMNLIVRCWRKKGNIGVKIHYLCHDLEQCVRAKHSNAWYNDERFENCNLHCKVIKGIFNKCT